MVASPVAAHPRRWRPATPSNRECRRPRLGERRTHERLHGTPLLLAVLAISVADIAFAVDSIPAALAVTRDAGVIWTANAFALLGLGALLALVEILVRSFRFLDKTIALILAFVGLKILLAEVVHVSDIASLAVIETVVTATSLSVMVTVPLDGEPIV